MIYQFTFTRKFNKFMSVYLRHKPIAFYLFFAFIKTIEEVLASHISRHILSYLTWTKVN